MIPAALTSVIKAVRGIYTINEQPTHHISTAEAASPQLTLSNGSHYITPNDFDTIYNVPASVTGAGVTIGIVSWRMPMRPISIISRARPEPLCEPYRSCSHGVRRHRPGPRPHRSTIRQQLNPRRPGRSYTRRDSLRECRPGRYSFAGRFLPIRGKRWYRRRCAVPCEHDASSRAGDEHKLWSLRIQRRAGRSSFLGWSLSIRRR